MSESVENGMKEFIPHPYQARGIQEIIEQKSVALWWDPGLGKTVTTLSAIKELWLDYWQISHVLIIAPLKVAESTWQSELTEWQHLSELFKVYEHEDTGASADQRGGPGEFWEKMESICTTLIGDAKTRRKRYEDSKRTPITVINRDNVKWLVDHVWAEDHGRWPYDMVVIDEATSFKNHASQRFKALRKVRGQIRRVVELTGTPASNGLMDLWAQLYLLDGGERLLRTITAYRSRYFSFNEYTHVYRPLAGSEGMILGRVGDICHSLEAKDYLDLPDYVEEDVPVNLTDKQLSVYKQFERDSVLELIDTDEKLISGSAAVLTNKLLQFSSGAVYDEEKRIHDLHDEKLRVFAEMMETAAEPVLIFYKFRFDLERIEQELKRQKKRYRVYKTDDDLRAWNDGELDALVASPESCGYGLNLQKGGRRILWYTVTWSHEVYKQANARLYRQGQTKPVIVQRLITRHTVDERVRQVLDGKATTHDLVMNYVKEYKNVK
nr:MAG TPA: Chromatin remodeling complex ATPase [Caudoviricetes sp.]